MEIKQQEGGSRASGRYKYQRLRERLREAIQKGELQGKLPGERELARRYNANAKTINKALCDLTVEGLLVRHVGRGTFVAAADHRQPPGKFHYVGVSAAEPATLELLEHLAGAIRQRGHRFDCLPVNTGDHGRIPENALSPGQLRGLTGVVIAGGAPSFELLADLHRRHLVVVLVGNTNERLRTHTVLADYGQGVFELTEHLLHLGHRKIGLVIAAELLPAARSAEAGYSAAMQRRGLPARSPVRLNSQTQSDPLPSGEGRPSALICVGTAAAREVVAHAAAAGLTSPSLLSIAVVPGPCEELPSPPLTAYEVPRDVVVDWSVELLLSAAPGQLPRVAIIPGQLTDRGSTGLPAGGRDQASPPPRQAVS